MGIKKSTQNSRNPANSDSLAGALKEIMGKFLAGVDDMLPAVVIEYDRGENRATVRPLIKILKTDGTAVDRAEIASVPVLSLGGGNGVLSFNISPGDLGWIKASDRDISLFLQNETPEDVPPNTLRKHNFSDSLFIPDQFRKFTIVDVDEEASILLQSLNGNSRISINEGEIKITTPLLVLEAGSIVPLGNIFHSGGNWTTFGGTITANGGDVISGGTSLRFHTHTGSPTAPSGAVSDTGQPV